jgi:hypothetical protein
MDVPAVLQKLEASALAAGIRDSLYAFPLIESLHVIGLTLVFGTIAIMDLRLLGVASARRAFTRVKGDIMPWTLIAFALTVTTGFLMFITNASVYYSNFQFRVKMGLILLSGINMLVFELGVGKAPYRWDDQTSPPSAAKLAGALSLLLWIGVIFMGRWVGFTSTRNVEPAPDVNLEDLFK